MSITLIGLKDAQRVSVIWGLSGGSSYWLPERYSQHFQTSRTQNHRWGFCLPITIAYHTTLWND